MAEKKLPDLKEFIDSINNAKKEKRSGKKVRFAFVKVPAQGCKRG